MLLHIFDRQKTHTYIVWCNLNNLSYVDTSAYAPTPSLPSCTRSTRINHTSLSLSPWVFRYFTFSLWIGSGVYSASPRGDTERDAHTVFASESTCSQWIQHLHLFLNKLIVGRSRSHSSPSRHLFNLYTKLALRQWLNHEILIYCRLLNCE